MNGEGSRILRERLDRCLGFNQRVSKVLVVRARGSQLFQHFPRSFKILAGQFRLMQPGFRSSRIDERFGVVDSACEGFC